MTESSESGKAKKREKRYASIRLTVSFSSLIFPLDFADLAQALKHGGYDMTLDVPPGGLGKRVGGAGTIAKKGEVSIVADSERKFIGVDSRSVKDVLPSFEQLTQILKDTLWVDVHAQARYYEAIVQMRVQANGNPTASIGHFFRSFKNVKRLESVIGEAVSLFTIRLVPLNKLPSGEDWFDIKVEPDVSLPESAYKIEGVYRKTDYASVKTFVSSIEAKIDTILVRWTQCFRQGWS